MSDFAVWLAKELSVLSIAGTTLGLMGVALIIALVWGWIYLEVRRLARWIRN